MSAFIRRRVLPSGNVRYYVVAVINGKQRGRGAYKLKRHAEARLREVRDELAMGGGPREATFTEFAETWLSDYVRLNVRRRTAHDYETIVRVRLSPAFGDMMLAHIRPSDVQSFLAEMSREGLSPATINKQLVLLKAIFDRAIEWGYLRESPARFVKRLKQPHREMDFYGPDEIRRFLEACPAGDRLLFATAIFTGLRQGELLALRWQDIDLVRQVLHVRRTYDPAFGFNEPKSAAGRRTVYMPPDLVDMFRDEGFAKAPADLVFSTEYGLPIDPDHLRRYMFYPNFKRAGLREIRFHDLRHTYAAMMIAIGASPKLLQEQLGHDSIDTTYRHYGHLMPSVSEGVAKRMQELVGAEKVEALEVDNVVPFKSQRERRGGT